jgi:hypothetical protein
MTDAGKPVDEQKHAQALDDDAGRKQREGEQRQPHGLAFYESAPPLCQSGSCLSTMET